MIKDTWWKKIDGPSEILIISKELSIDDTKAVCVATFDNVFSIFAQNESLLCFLLYNPEADSYAFVQYNHYHHEKMDVIFDDDIKPVTLLTPILVETLVEAYNSNKKIGNIDQLDQI
jgi:hypothetical protein